MLALCTGLASEAASRQIWDAAGAGVGLVVLVGYSLGSRREQQGTTDDFEPSAHSAPSVVATGPAAAGTFRASLRAVSADSGVLVSHDHRTGVLGRLWRVGGCPASECHGRVGGVCRMVGAALWHGRERGGGVTVLWSSPTRPPPSPRPETPVVWRCPARPGARAPALCSSR